MKNSGLSILGLGKRTTAFYINELNIQYNVGKTIQSSCTFQLLNSNFDEINELLPEPSAELSGVIQKYVEEIKSSHLLIPNITLHETIDNLEVNSKVIHPVPLTVERLKEKDCTEVVLIGSLYSMESNYLKSTFEQNSIKVETPSSENQQIIDDYRKQVYSNVETEISILSYFRIIEKYSQKTQVVIACTELSIYQHPINNMIVDMAQLQIAEAVKIVSEINKS